MDGAERAHAAVPVTVGVGRAEVDADRDHASSAPPSRFRRVAIRAQTTGQLTSVNFTEGDDVKQGQVLFALDRRPLEAALQQAQANLDRDMAQAANAALAGQALSGPRRARHRARASRWIRRAPPSTALERHGRGRRAAVENAKVQLQYATITAPISGRTGALMVHEGNLVRANDTTPLVVINQVAPISVSFAIPEARLPELKRYMARGSLRVDGRVAATTRPRRRSGRITFVDNSVDQTTGTIRIKGTFPNTDRRLWPGQYVNVVVTLTTDPEAIVVPSVAVQAGQQGPYVFVVNADQTVELRPVTVGRDQRRGDGDRERGEAGRDRGDRRPSAARARQPHHASRARTSQPADPKVAS